MGWELSLLLLGEDDGEEVWDISENDDLGVQAYSGSGTAKFQEVGGWLILQAITEYKLLIDLLIKFMFAVLGRFSPLIRQLNASSLHVMNT